MPRSKKADAASANGSASPGQGHNTKGPLTEQEEEALQTWHEMKIRAGRREVAAAAEVLKTKRDEVNGHFKRMTADLRFTRLAFEDMLADQDLPEFEFLEKEAKRARLYRNGGLNMGTQQELALGDTVDDKVAAEASGRRAYRANRDPVPPAEVSPILHPDWMRGWQGEQTKVAMQMQMAAEVMARPKPGELAAAPKDPEDAEGEDDADPEVIKRKAKALKDTGWAEPTPQEQRFEASDEELAGQRPRQAIQDAHDGRTSGEPVEDDDDDDDDDADPVSAPDAVNDLQPEAVA